MHNAQLPSGLKLYFQFSIYTVDFKNLVVRTLAGAVMVAVIIGATIWTPYSFGIVFMLISLLATQELMKLLTGKIGRAHV